MEVKHKLLDAVVSQAKDIDSELSDFEDITTPYPRGPHLSDCEQTQNGIPRYESCHSPGKKNRSCSSMTNRSALVRELEDFYERRVCTALSRKRACEDIAYAVTHKILRKVQTVDDRFRGTNLVPHGIAYDGLKAGKPIFFEMILNLSLGVKDTLVVAKDDDSTFFRIRPMSGELWKDCMTRSGFILASKVQSLLRKYVKQAVHVLRKYVSQGRTEKYPNGLKSLFIEGATGVCLIINRDIHVRVLPAFCIPDIRNDFKRRDCPSCSHVVCCSKTTTSNGIVSLFSEPQDDKGIIEDTKGLGTAWKVSFYVAEKNKMRALSDGCRIKLLRILTEIRDNEDVLNNISSYHLKTLLFHVCDEIPDAETWDQSFIDERYIDLLRKLHWFMSSKSMPHYFMKGSEYPSFNLFEDIPETLLESMAEFIKKMISNPLEILSSDRERQRGDLWPWDPNFDPMTEG